MEKKKLEELEKLADKFATFETTKREAIRRLEDTTKMSELTKAVGKLNSDNIEVLSEWDEILLD